MALMKYGPIYLSVSAQNWIHYKTGVFSNCDNNTAHGVILVGWD